MTREHCPRCSKRLTDAVVDGRNVGACPDAHGALLPAPGIQNLPVASVAAIEEELERSEATGVACPGCGSVTRAILVRRGDDAIELDACASCGAVWFDAGEVERLRAPIAAGAAGAASKPTNAAGFADSASLVDPHIVPVAIEGIGPLLEGLFGLLDGI